ncbi:MAG: methionyl-tRNA formyltransferase [Candidatus Omnitrophica bacterium]|jgi:methionyl-tRNA formyltransferase|nr:methionyl-tRNA formyltransferase [Candidatus Omnitrophota bacterium]
MSKEARFIYFGSSQFSKTVLEGLCNLGLIPLLVVTKPDRPKGRGLMVHPTETSDFATKKKIPLIKPEHLVNKDCLEAIRQNKADLFIIVDYGKIIPSSLLSLPRILPLSLHPSLLPRYRGPAPIEYAIKNGDSDTGVTIFKVVKGIDTGDIILQKKIKIDYQDNFYSLSHKLAFEGTSLLNEAILKIKNNDYILIAQNEDQATLTHKFNKEDGRINWELSAFQIRNLVRALVSWPSAYTYYKNILIKILEAEVIDRKDSDLAGTVASIDKEGISVATTKGVLKIKRLKPQGKKEMSAWDFVSGYRLKVGEHF